MRQWTDILKQISMLTQFGLSFITPLLCTRAGVGGWVYLIGFFFGLGGSFTVAWKWYRQVQKKEKTSGRAKVRGYNRHD